MNNWFYSELKDEMIYIHDGNIVSSYWIMPDYVEITYVDGNMENILYPFTNCMDIDSPREEEKENVEDNPPPPPPLLPLNDVPIPPPLPLHIDDFDDEDTEEPDHLIIDVDTEDTEDLTDDEEDLTDDEELSDDELIQPPEPVDM